MKCVKTKQFNNFTFLFFLTLFLPLSVLKAQCPAQTLSCQFRVSPSTTWVTDADCSGVFCTGASISMRALEFNAAWTYSWTGPNGFTSTNRPISVNGISATTAGTYTLTITNPGNGCVYTKNFTVILSPLGGTVAATPITCNGATNGALAVTATGGSGSYEYALNGGAYQPSNSFTGLGAGYYTITIKDLNPSLPCTYNLYYNMAAPISAKFDIDENTCNGTTADNNGAIKLVAQTGATKTGYSVGTTYSGPAFASATTIGALPFSVASSLTNPTTPVQEYTVRLFSSATCFQDFVVRLNKQTCAGACYCTEYVYLNDPIGSRVHKFKINNDATWTEIFNNGNVWYPGSGVSEMPSPHGLGVDLNGKLYIGETGGPGDVRKLDADGNIFPESNFVINAGSYNFASQNGYLYMRPNTDPTKLCVYDLCTGAKLGCVCLDDGDVATPTPSTNFDHGWGLSLDKATGTFYITSYAPFKALWKIQPTFQDFIDGTCYNPLIKVDVTLPLVVGDFKMPHGSTFGVATDMVGNIYMVEQEGDFTNGPFRLLKYSPTGQLLAIGPSDGNGNDAQGWQRASGLVYSAITNRLYLTSQNGFQDCVSQFDTNLNYLGAAIGPAGDINNDGLQDANAKGIAIVKECCPTTSAAVIDTVLCAATLNQKIFLTDLINCNGTIAAGTWQQGATNTGFSFNQCDNSIEITGQNACGTFTLTSSGTGNNPQCGAFTITVNVSAGSITAPVVAGSQMVCSGADPAAFTVTTPAVSGSTITYQWQSSTTNCTTGFTNIASATSATFDPPTGITQTTYYRIIAKINENCAAGACADTSNCVTVTITPTATGITMTQTAPTCTSGVAQNNGKITLTAISNANKYGISTGATYTGTAYAAATTLATVPPAVDVVTNAPNAGQTYTIRFFSGSDNCYKDTTITVAAAVCVPCSITATFTQSTCNNNGTPVTGADDYFQVTVSAVSATSGGASGKYEVVLNGIVLNTGGTTYGAPITVGTTTTFVADGASTYQLKVRDIDMPSCERMFMTTPTAACSTIPCPTRICLPITATRN